MTNKTRQDLVQPVCKACNSPRICFEAQTRWNVKTQKMVIDQVMDRGYCMNCGYTGGGDEFCNWECVCEIVTHIA